MRGDLEWLVKAITGQPETSGKKRGREGERERGREGGRKRWREGEREPYKPPLIKKLNHFEIVTMDIKLRFVVIATLASIALGFKPDDDVINDSLNEAKLRPFEEAHQFCLNKPGKKRYLLNFESFSHTFSNYPL